MGYDVHEVPRPLNDEDKWFKLTKRQWLIMFPAILLSFFVIRFTYRIGFLPIGIALSVIFVICAFCLAFVELPPEKYLFGTGFKLEKLAIRIIRKKMPKNKKIYVKNYENGYKEWMDKL